MIDRETLEGRFLPDVCVAGAMTMSEHHAFISLVQQIPQNGPAELPRFMPCLRPMCTSPDSDR